MRGALSEARSRAVVVSVAVSRLQFLIENLNAAEGRAFFSDSSKIKVDIKTVHSANFPQNLPSKCSFSHPGPPGVVSG